LATAQLGLGNSRKTSFFSFFLFFASSRETLPQGLCQASSDALRLPFGTSATAFQPKSTFAFTLQVKPGKLHDEAPSMQDGRALRRYRKRCKVERTLAWLQNFRRLWVRQDRLISVCQGFSTLPARSSH
jgi:hypothetical protein